MKRVIRINENDIRQIVRECVKKAIKEGGMDCEFLSPWGDEFLPVGRFDDDEENDDKEEMREWAD